MYDNKRLKKTNFMNQCTDKLKKQRKRQIQKKLSFINSEINYHANR